MISSRSVGLVLLSLCCVALIIVPTVLNNNNNGEWELIQEIGPPKDKSLPPATVFDRPEENADWWGVTAPLAKNLPRINSIEHHRYQNYDRLRGFDGAESRGTFRVERATEENWFWLYVTGMMDHRITCVLRSFRDLHEAEGPYYAPPTVVRTGYRQVFSGKGEITTGYIPGGNVGEFDILSCKDLNTGEVQHFKWDSP